MLGSASVAEGRRFCAVGLSLAIALCATLVSASAAGAKAKGFKYGVAAGDVTSKSAILWAKAEKSGTAVVQVAHNTGFGACDKQHSYAKVEAKKSNDNTVQKKV